MIKARQALRVDSADYKFWLVAVILVYLMKEVPAAPQAGQGLAFNVPPLLGMTIVPDSLVFHITDIPFGADGLNIQTASYYIVVNNPPARIQISLDQDMPPNTALAIDGEVPIDGMHGSPGPITSKPRDLVSGIPVCNVGPKLIQFTFSASYLAAVGAFDRVITFTLTSP
jgi:hypothetical protein